MRQLETRLRAGGLWREHDLVFPSVIGTPLNNPNVTHAFQRHLARLGLPRIRFHDPRYTAATLMLSQGVHPKIVQEMLGHSQIGLTMDTYSHVLPLMQREAAERMEAIRGK